MPDGVDYPDVIGFETLHKTLSALLSGELPDGTKVYPPSQIVAVDDLDAIHSLLCDRFTGAEVAMSHPHWTVHTGRAFSVSAIETLAASASFTLGITPAAGAFIHLEDVDCSATGGPVTIEIVRGATLSGGTPKTAHNRNHNSARTSSANAASGVTATEGTVVKTILVPAAAQGSQRSPGSAGTDHEMILIPETPYALRFTNIGTAEIQIGYDVFWYEMGGE